MSSIQRKTAKKEAWRPKCAAPRLGDEQNQKDTYCCSYLGHQNEVTFVGETSALPPKSKFFVFFRLFRIREPMPTWEGGREVRRRKEVLNEEARVAASYQKIKQYRAVLHTRYQVANGRLEGGGKIGKSWMARE